MDIELPIIKNKEAVRNINLSNIQFGGDKSFSFMSENDNISKYILPIFLYHVIGCIMNKSSEA